MTTADVRPAAPAGGDPAATAAPARPWWLVAAAPAAVVVALLAVVAAGSFSGAFRPFTYFTDPGAGVRWGMPVSIVLTELSAAVTLGSLVLAACVLPAGRAVERGLAVAGVASGVWAVAATAHLVLHTSWSTFVPVGDPVFGRTFWSFVTDGEVGRAYLGVVVVAAVTSAVALAVRGPVGALWTAAIAVVAVALQAGTGHAAGASSHDLAISAMFLHLGGAALWVGGLAAIALLGLRDAAAPATIRRYSVIAGWCYAAVAVSGLVSAWIRLGSVDALATDYGVLLIVKAALLVVLGTLGWLHRRTVLRRLPDDGVRRGPGERPPSGSVPRLFWRLAAVELLVMGAVSGVAVALGSTAAPIPEVPVVDASAAQRVTGHALPAEPTLARWFTEFQWDLLLAFGCAAALIAYLTWAVRLARRGDRWPVSRTVSWCLGIVVLFWATNGGAAVYGHVLFSAHMVQHMVLAMVVPLLLVLAAPVTLLLRAVPARRDGSRGPREWILALVHSRWGRLMAHPIVAAVLFAGGMIAFYYTPLFELSLRSYAGHVWMIAHFTLVGYLFANALVGIDPGPSRPSYPMRIVLLFATMAFHAFFGVALTTGTALLVPEWFGLLGRPWGPSAIEDQQRGGAVAWGIGELPTLLLAIGVAISWTRSDTREARRQDRAADRDGDAELEAYNAMLAKMAKRKD